MLTFCSTCGKEIVDGGNFCVECGHKTNTSNSTKIPIIQTRSKFWYLLPIVFGFAGGIFGIIGGSIAYLVLRKSDPKKGKYCLIIGIIFTMIGVIFGMVAMDSLYTEDLSTENDFFEEYWEQHPDEDPCNDPTARAFGLCK